MCSVCGAINGHRNGCPEAEPIVVGKCRYCGDDIQQGETVYIDEYGNSYHEYCAQDNALDILESMYQFKRDIAE